jgi:hypothetical protein
MSITDTDETTEEVDETTDDVIDQVQRMVDGKQVREPGDLSTAIAQGEGEHQMKGAFAEVNPIGPANAAGAAKRAADVLAHQQGTAPAVSHAKSLTVPGVDNNTDLAIAEDTRVAGGREVLGDTNSAVDVEGAISEQVEDIKAAVVEAHNLGADVVIPDPDAVVYETPESTGRIAVFDEDGNLRPNEDLVADFDELVASLPEPADIEVATSEEIDEFEPEVETDPEALAEAQEERTEEEQDGDEEAEDDPEAEGPPAKSANKPVWVDYAVAQGYDRDECEALTKEELVAQFGDD